MKVLLEYVMLPELRQKYLSYLNATSVTKNESFITLTLEGWM